MDECIVDLQVFTIFNHHIVKTLHISRRLFQEEIASENSP